MIYSLPRFKVEPTKIWYLNGITLEPLTFLRETLLPKSKIFNTEQKVHFGVAMGSSNI